MQILTILVIEDEDSLLQLYRIVLEKEGFKVLTVHNGQEAWDLIENEHVDLVITDILMPVMDGFTLMKQLKMENKYAHIPIIVTSQGGDKSIEKSFALGATDFVEKPYNPRIIMHRVQNVVMAYKNARSEAAATNEKNDSVS